jgi:hypothetical protein
LGIEIPRIWMQHETCFRPRYRYLGAIPAVRNPSSHRMRGGRLKIGSRMVIIECRKSVSPIHLIRAHLSSLFLRPIHRLRVPIPMAQVVNKPRTPQGQVKQRTRHRHHNLQRRRNGSMTVHFLRGIQASHIADIVRSTSRNGRIIVVIVEHVCSRWSELMA